MCSIAALLVVVHLSGQVADPEAIDGPAVAAKIYALVEEYFAHWEGVNRDDVRAAYRKYVDDVRGTATSDRSVIGFPMAGRSRELVLFPTSPST